MEQRRNAERSKGKDRLHARLDKLRAEYKALATGNAMDGSSAAINSNDLRFFQSLARDVEKQLSRMGIEDHKTDSSTNSDSHVSDEGNHSRHHSRRRRGKKLKSGKMTEVVSRVVRPQIWPQSELSLSYTYVSKDVRYEDLSVEEFVAGYSSILALHTISQTEHQARIQHLTHLMYLATIYEWSAVQGFNAAVSMEIEHGRLNWGDLFTLLEICPMAECLKRVASASTLKELKRNVPNVLFCREFQRGSFSHNIIMQWT